MRSMWKVAVVAGLLAVPQLAVADENVEEQLLQMQERMNQLEQQLTATNDQLQDSQRRVDEQEQLIERAGLEERSAASGIASFFEQVEFGGWVAASWFYNFNGLNTSNNNVAGGNTISGGVNNGTFGTAYPFHPDHNSFQLDQLWFEMEKAASEDSRGGFGADIVFGKTADRLTGSSTSTIIGSVNNQQGFITFSDPGSNGNQVAIYQAYAEWLAPLGPGVSVKGGRFATHVGAEVAQTVYNFNISRGLVYSVLQPINHVGLKASAEWDNGLSAMIGVANTALDNRNTDFDDDKAILWHIGYSQDAWGISYNGIAGGDSSSSVGPKCGGGFSIAPGTQRSGEFCRSNDRAAIHDFVVNWDPSENLATYLNVTYRASANTKTIGYDPWGIGLAAAGRLAITEATGFALRFEYLYSNDNLLGIGALPVNVATNDGTFAFSDAQLFGITGTLDHALTESLMVKAEARYDTGTINRSINDNTFFYRDWPGLTTTDQLTVGAEMSYRF